MRLIDADELKKSEIKRCGCVPTIGSCYNDEKRFDFVLQEQPTVDAVPVVHGEWEQLCDPYFSKTIPTISRCTACGKKYNLPNISYNYCPNCGAKMDGEET